VSAEVARELVDRGYIVGVASDWPRSSQQPLWSRHGVEPEFVGGKHHLHDVREQFPADRYVHVGDTEVDERYALLAGFEFLLVDDLELPVVADTIHAEDWTPSA
jgi:phosphoglycolate phosphatase-like HAD superfamily hydrolase